MRTRITLLACLVVLGGMLQARIGETLEQCSVRYGPVIEKRQVESTLSDPGAAVFSKSAVTIYVEFHAGQAWHIIFRKPSLSSADLDSLLEANAWGGDWGSMMKFGDRGFCLSPDHKVIAVKSEAKGPVPPYLEIMTRDYAEQRHVVPADHAYVPGAGTSAVEETKPKVNPLPGF